MGGIVVADTSSKMQQARSQDEDAARALDELRPDQRADRAERAAERAMEQTEGRVRGKAQRARDKARKAK